MPKALQNDAICSKSLIIFSVKVGSIAVGANVDTNSIGTGASAASAVSSSISSNGIGGTPAIVTNVAAFGYSSTSSSSTTTNLGLILGVSIPLGLLCTF